MVKNKVYAGLVLAQVLTFAAYAVVTAGAGAISLL